MKDIVIFGLSDFSKRMKLMVDNYDVHNRKVVAFTVTKSYINTSVFCELPVVPFEDVESLYPPEQYDILIAIGYNDMNDIRKRFFIESKNKGYTVASYIHHDCVIYNSWIGEGNIMLDRCIIGPFSKVGDCNLLWGSAGISHDSVLGSFNTLSGHAETCGYVQIGDNCYLGKYSLINDCVKISDYTYVGAKAYVKTNTKPYDVIVAPKSEIVQRINSRRFVKMIDALNSSEKITE